MDINDDPPPQPPSASRETDVLAAENAAVDARVVVNAAERAEWAAEMAAAGIVPGKPAHTRHSARTIPISGVKALDYVVAASLQDWKARPVDVEQVRLLDVVRECDLAINRAHAARAAAINDVARWIASTATDTDADTADDTPKRPVDVWAELADPNHDWASTPF
ncbi:hypothetical protein [Cryobacterium sp. Y11]|uniref:hypothetical protein n=1 Tax=Cryobacterium sp. Y11 TaxID=2045016 RepID=UPI000CE4857B|nr:hypothetical protein [Cryobacterium sp. Y11]